MRTVPLATFSCRRLCESTGCPGCRRVSLPVQETVSTSGQRRDVYLLRRRPLVNERVVVDQDEESEGQREREVGSRLGGRRLRWRSPKGTLPKVPDALPRSTCEAMRCSQMLHATLLSTQCPCPTIFVNTIGLNIPPTINTVFIHLPTSCPSSPPREVRSLSSAPETEAEEREMCSPPVPPRLEAREDSDEEGEPEEEEASPWDSPSCMTWVATNRNVPAVGKCQSEGAALDVEDRRTTAEEQSHPRPPLDVLDPLLLIIAPPPHQQLQQTPSRQSPQWRRRGKREEDLSYPGAGEAAGHEDCYEAEGGGGFVDHDSEENDEV